jgi:hypothetical protein
MAGPTDPTATGEAEAAGASAKSASTPRSESVVKISANLPVEDVEVLKQLAAERRETMTGVLRDAIATEKYFADVISQGGKVLVEDARGVVHRVVFR